MEIYANDGGDHAFVIIKLDKNFNHTDPRIGGSELKNAPILIVDAWQKKVFTVEEAWKNKYISNKGKAPIRWDTPSFQPQRGYEDLKKKNIKWDKQAKTWKPKPGYKMHMNSGAWMGYCDPE